MTCRPQSKKTRWNRAFSCTLEENLGGAFIIPQGSPETHILRDREKEKNYG
jgi:hypothetical protein